MQQSMDASPDEAPTQPGGIRIFGDYALKARCGRGAIGETFLALPLQGPHEGKSVCLKVLRADYEDDEGGRSAAIEALRHEARVTQRLVHPNIAALLDFGAYEDVWWTAFEYIEGANLAQVLARLPRNKGLAQQQVAYVGREVAKALACAHAQDVLHRDIKPQNIMVSGDGRVVLVDFGVAKVHASRARQFTMHVGTRGYWAPEQARGDVLSPATDIYALGLVMLEALTRQAVPRFRFVGGLRSWLARQAFYPSSRLRGVPGEMRPILRRCLHPDPRKRYDSAQALVEELHALAAPGETMVALARKRGRLGLPAVTEAFESSDGTGASSQTTDSDGGDGSTWRVESELAVAQRAVDAVPRLDPSYQDVVADLGRFALRKIMESSESQPPPSVWRQTGLNWLVGIVGVVIGAVWIPAVLKSDIHGGQSLAETAVGETRPGSGQSQVQARVGATQGPVQSPSPLQLPSVVVPALSLPAAQRGGDRTTKPGASDRSRVTTSATRVGRPAAKLASGSARAHKSQKRESASHRTSLQRAQVSAKETTRHVWVVIGAIPDGRVTVDGRDLGWAPVNVKLAKGKHRVVVRINGVREARWIEVGEESSEPFVFDLRTVSPNLH